MKLQHYILGRAAKSKPYDKQYFDSITCKKDDNLHFNNAHYAAGEKYCARDEVFLRVEESVMFCPKCGCQLRTGPANPKRANKVEIARY